MTTETGSAYINRCRTLGFSDQKITEAMQTVGWLEADIHTAFVQANTLQLSPTAKTPGARHSWLWLILGLVGLIVVGAIGSALYFVVLQ